MDFSFKHGDVILYKNNHWILLHFSCIDMSQRETFRKNVKDHTGLYMFSGLWYEGNRLTDKPYGKCLEQLKVGMYPDILLVGNVANDTTLFDKL